MVWARLEDSFPEHQKIGALSDRAFRVLVTAICYSARNLTDGHIAAHAVAGITRGSKKPIGELVAAGLLHQNGDGGYLVHDYLDYNPPAEEVKRKRREAAERMRDLRNRP